MTETKWFKALSFLHLVVILSLCFFGICTVTLTVLAVPALCAAFAVGRDLIEHRFNVYEGLVKRFFGELKQYRRSMRFFPVWLLVLLQSVGIIAAQSMNRFLLQVILLVFGAFLLTYLCYACAYIVFIDAGIRCEEVLIRMFGQVKILFSLFCMMILVLVFFQLRFLPVLLIGGALLLLAVEAVIYITLKQELEEKEQAPEGGSSQ